MPGARTNTRIEQRRSHAQTDPFDGVSLDGFVAGPDGAIDWGVPDEELHRFHNQQMQETGVPTYEVVSG